MDCTASNVQYSNDGYFDVDVVCNRKNTISRDKKSPIEICKTFQNVKLNGINAEEDKNSCISFNKPDGQTKKLYNNLRKDNNQSISRSFEKNRNSSDNFCDLGVAQESNDGTDSGIEVIRALSSNGSNSDRFTPVQSCGSSLVSYSSEPEADRGSECESESSEKSRVRKGSNCSSQGSSCWKFKKTYDRSRISRKANGYDGISESCSETSSTHEAVTPDQLTRSIDFKLSASNRLHEFKKSEKAKSSTARRSESSSRNNSHDKNISLRSTGSGNKVTSSSKSYSVNRNVKLGATAKCEIRGSKTKTEDGRWSQKSQSNGARIRVSSVADPTRKIHLNSMSCSMTTSLNGGNVKMSEGKSNALDKYGTLPRRPKRKSADAVNISINQTSLTRSHSVTREPSLNRAATLRRQQSKEKENPSSNCKSLPPYPRARRGTAKILIYHEVGVQTVITSEDISSTSPGVFIKDKPAEFTPQNENKEIQTEGKDRLKTLENNYAKLCEETEKAKKENEELKLEKQTMISRICKLLGYVESAQGELKENGLKELEEHFQAVGLTVIKQQEELSELRHYKLIAHRDLEKSLAAQKNLLHQQQEIEEEYSELQEFLQAEKTALSESLLDTEQELNRLRTEIAKKQTLLEQQQEECKHLVRICEQRRQENLSLKAKLSGLDQRSRDVLVQQGAAVSAAAVALSGLGARLDSLVEQLSVSCNIQEKNLEDVDHHHEVYRKIECDFPDDTPLESQPANEFKLRESFIQIIISAIKNAAQSSLVLKKNFEDRKVPDQNETFFVTEIEPSMNLENNFEENPLSGSENQIRSKNMEKHFKGIESESKYGYELSRSNSLQKLSDAILNRQMIEKNERIVALDEIIPIEVNSLVSQIVDVDNLVTKLLKVINIIMKEKTERHIGKLQEERDNLTSQLQQEKIIRYNVESNLKALQQELTEARRQLNARIAQLEEVKILCGENQKLAIFEMKKRSAVIDTALGALNSVQGVVNQNPQLAKLQRELKDCHFQRATVSDINANSTTNDNGLVEDMKPKGAVLTTAI